MASDKTKAKRLYKHVLIALIVICVIALVVFSVSYWMAYQAARTEESIESYAWINNDHCLAEVADLPAPGPSFRFAVFGDIQGGVGQLPRLMESLKEKAPVSFIIQTGDAASHADAGHYKLLLHELVNAKLWLPMFVVPGNHDVRGDDPTLFERYFGPKNLWFKYGNALFILLDNSLSPLDDAQYEWLENVLEKNRGGVQHAFLFMHCPPIDWEGDGARKSEHLYERLFGLLKKYRVGYLFSGHRHTYHREERDGTVFVVNGRGGDFDHNEMLVPCYYSLVEIRGDSVKDTCIELPPSMNALVQSIFENSAIAHLGEFTINNRWSMLSLLLLLIVCSGVLLFLRSKNAKTSPL